MSGRTSNLNLCSCVLYKLSLYMHAWVWVHAWQPNVGLTVDSSQLTFLPSSKSCDTKTRTNIKNSRIELRHCALDWESVVSCQLPLQMAKEIAFENGRISNFQGLVTLTLDRVLLHTIVHHSSTSLPTCHFIKIKETFCGRMDIQTNGWREGHLRPTLLGRLKIVDLKIKTKEQRILCTELQQEAYQASELPLAQQPRRQRWCACVQLPTNVGHTTNGQRRCCALHQSCTSASCSSFETAGAAYDTSNGHRSQHLDLHQTQLQYDSKLFTHTSDTITPSLTVLALAAAAAAPAMNSKV